MTANQYSQKANQNEEVNIHNMIEMEEQEKEGVRFPRMSAGQQASNRSNTYEMDEEKRPYPIRADSIRSNISMSSGTSDGDFVESSEPNLYNYHDGIFWRSPILMGGNLLLGIIASVSHHVYYSFMVGKQVGDDYAQQWVLR